MRWEEGPALSEEQVKHAALTYSVAPVPPARASGRLPDSCRQQSQLELRLSSHEEI